MQGTFFMSVDKWDVIRAQRDGEMEKRAVEKGKAVIEVLTAMERDKAVVAEHLPVNLEVVGGPAEVEAFLSKKDLDLAGQEEVQPEVEGNSPGEDPEVGELHHRKRARTDAEAEAPVAIEVCGALAFSPPLEDFFQDWTPSQVRILLDRG